MKHIAITPRSTPPRTGDAAAALAILVTLCCAMGPVRAAPGGAGSDLPAPTHEADAWARRALPIRPQGPAVPVSELLARALSRDPQVRAARANLAATEQRAAQMESRRWPVAGLAVVNGRGKERDQNIELQRRTERADATLKWNLYNGGNDEAEITATRLEVQAALLEVRRTQEEAAERLLEVALELTRLDRQLPASLQRLDAVQGLVTVVRRQTELGRLAEIDLQQALSSVVDARLVHDQLLAERDGTRLKLSHLAGEAIDRLDDFELAGLGMADPATTRLSGADLDSLVAEHAGIRAARQRAQAARSRVRPVETLAAPRVDLDLNRRLSDHTAPQLSSEQRQGWQVGVRWEMPLGGETVARRNETVHRAEAAEAEADRLTQITVAELASQGPRVVSAEQSVTWLRGQIDQAQQLIRAGEVQFEAGRRGVQQLIQLRDQRFNAEQRLADQLLRLDQARLRQMALTGRLLRAFSL